MFATIYLPDFYLQAAMRHQPELLGEPVALIDDQEKKAVIVQLNAAAEAAGVRLGMTPSQGLARTLALIIKVRSAPQEKILREILLHFAGTLGPYVEDTAPGIATVQFTNQKNLGDKVTGVVTELARSEIAAQAGIASTPDASFLAAHLGKPVLQIDETREFLAGLPIEVLAITC
jgi:nucleotidyltransferase/DNA polymerase involved in DNA repair